MANCEWQRQELVQRARGLEGEIPVRRGGSIEVRPGVVRGTVPRKRHARTESDSRVEFPGGHRCSLKLKMLVEMILEGLMDTLLIGQGSLRLFK